MKKFLIILLFSIAVSFFSACGAVDFEEYDPPAVPDTIYLPPEKQKLAAVLGTINYFVDITRTDIVWDEDKDYTYDETYSQYDDDYDGDTIQERTLYEDGLVNSDGNKVNAVFGEGSYFSEVLKESIIYGDNYPTDTNDFEVLERRSYYEGKYIIRSISGYTLPEVRAGSKYGYDAASGLDFLDPVPAKNFSITSTSTLSVSVKGEEVLPTDDGDNISDGHSIIMSGEFQASFKYLDSDDPNWDIGGWDPNVYGTNYTYTVKLEEFYYIYGYMQDFDEATNKFVEIEVITYGGTVTIDGQKFVFAENIVVPKKGTDSGK